MDKIIYLQAFLKEGNKRKWVEIALSKENYTDKEVVSCAANDLIKALLNLQSYGNRKIRIERRDK